jgi:hypothetical protein
MADGSFRCRYCGSCSIHLGVCRFYGFVLSANLEKAEKPLVFASGDWAAPPPFPIR